MKWLKYLIILPGILSIHQLYGQNAINIQYGLNIANVNTNDFTELITPNRASIIGNAVQLTYERTLVDNLSLSAGVAYKEKGFEIEEKTNISILNIPVPVGGRIRTEITSVEIPIFLKYKVNNIDFGLKPYFLAGGGYSFNLDGRIKPYATIMGDIALPELNIDNQVNDNELFASIGMGLSGKIGSGHLFGEVTYNQAFENYTSDFVVDIPIKNRSFTVGIGYTMPIF